MLTISAAEVDRALTFPGLVETLRTAFRDGAVQPVRHHHAVERPDGAASTLLLMPAWTDFNAAGTSAGGHIGVKIVTVSPDNNAIGKPAVMGALSAARRRDRRAAGADRRPAADAMAHRLRLGARRLLSRPRGRLAAAGGRRRRAVRRSSPRRIRRCGRSRPSASGTARRPMPRRSPPSCAPTASTASAAGDLDAELGRGRHRLLRDDLDHAAGQGRAAEAGHPCRPGRRLHADNAREPTTMRSRRARVYVDTRAGATKEAGDIVQPLASGVLKPEAIVADLHELARGQKTGPRRAPTRSRCSSRSARRSRTSPPASPSTRRSSGSLSKLRSRRPSPRRSDENRGR